MIVGAARTQSLLVAEVFGPTFQGEGPSAGQQAMFVRLSRCNLRCPRCDTPFTWDTSRYDLRQHSHRLPVADVVDQVLAAAPKLVVITGGEPLLQQPAVTALAQAVDAAGRRVEIETNGTVAPDDVLAEAVAAFNVSPKLASFSAPGDRTVNPRALRALAGCGRAVFKFVVSTTTDLAHVAQMVDQFGLSPVWVMPAGTDSDAILAGMRAVAEETLRRGWHLTSRLHILLWEDERGR
jgi:7-carboxy-7-deazaguanine synthase